MEKCTEDLKGVVCSAASHLEDLSMWDLWLTKWQRDSVFFSYHFEFRLPLSSHQCSTFINSSFIDGT